MTAQHGTPAQGAPEGYDDPPSWYDEFGAALAYADHVVLSGNTNDLYPSLAGPHLEFRDLEATLWSLLQTAGLRALLVFDPVEGLRLHSATGASEKEALTKSGLAMGRPDDTLAALRATHEALRDFTDFPVALLVDHASHLHDGDWALEEFFVAMDRDSRTATSGNRHNPTIWRVDQPADLPDWFVLGNAALREIQLEFPNLEDRFRYGQSLADASGWTADVSEADRERLIQQFALECEGQTLAEMRSIARVAEAEGHGLTRISDAIRVFRTGARRNPWTSPVLRHRMGRATELLGARIKGQPHALEKTLDILARSILGLSGAQSGAMHTRPRGALFFVGPTGVGKTELAKAITELLFGDETACHRFDMSEFMAENSIARLIGAPPGHPGHEKGGELINAAHRRPFSVFLFDEVEKAHPRVLDLFLQLLDEGRLTDARGTTAYFSEALIIFTSNIGMVHGSRADNMGMNVLPSDSYGELSSKIRRAVEEHFRIDLRRPELLNRIGQNIVAFDFLKPDAMSAILESLLKRVVTRIEAEHRISVTLMPAAMQSLRRLCTQDFFDGGRGIANRIETHLINPIARQLFLMGTVGDLVIADVTATDGATTLVLDETSGPGMPRAKDADPRPRTAASPVHPVHPVHRPDQSKMRAETG